MPFNMRHLPRIPEVTKNVNLLFLTLVSFMHENFNFQDSQQ